MEGRIREILKNLSLITIGSTNKNFIQCVQHIELGNGEIGAAIDLGNIACNNGIEPAHTPWTPSCRTKLAPQSTQLLALQSMEFRWHRPCPYLSTVGLADTDNACNSTRRNTRSGRSPRCSR